MMMMMMVVVVVVVVVVMMMMSARAWKGQFTASFWGPMIMIMKLQCLHFFFNCSGPSKL